MSTKQQLKDNFEHACLALTKHAATFYLRKEFCQVQRWLNIDLPTEWGWKYKEDFFMVTPMEIPPIPEFTLQIVACNSNKQCTKVCSCQKSNIFCTNMCGHCPSLNYVNCQLLRII